MDAAGVIAHYVMDGDQPITAETGGNNTYYLYFAQGGVGGIYKVDKTSGGKPAGAIRPAPLRFRGASQRTRRS